MEKLSIYGGTGFVGSEFCKQTKRSIELIPRNSRTPVSKEILYFISTTHNYHIFDDIQKDVDTNLKVMLDVLDKIREEGYTFNFISSWFVYGDTTLPAKESNDCKPKGFYSITKRAAEQMLISFCETYKLNYRILRLCNVYGPGDAGVSKKKNALQYMINQMKAHQPVDLYDNGQFYRDYMHVSDVARAIDLVVEKGPLNSVINIGSGERILFKDIFDKARKITNSKSEVTNISPPHFHTVVQVKNFYMDCSKLKNMGFKPLISIEQGIEKLCL
ncbi:MAG: NAD-dependent epimerase/dehydratase family protein [Bdellovibrionota bacterium]